MNTDTRTLGQVVEDVMEQANRLLGTHTKRCAAIANAVLAEALQRQQGGWRLLESNEGAAYPPIGSEVSISFDGFIGTVIGSYQRRDGKRGVVLQQNGTNIVHVYGEKWLGKSQSYPQDERAVGIIPTPETRPSGQRSESQVGVEAATCPAGEAISQPKPEGGEHEGPNGAVDLAAKGPTPKAATPQAIQSDTPRTWAEIMTHKNWDPKWIDADFARQLERELNEAMRNNTDEEVKMSVSQYADICERTTQLEQQLAQRDEELKKIKSELCICEQLRAGWKADFDATREELARVRKENQTWHIKLGETRDRCNELVLALFCKNEEPTSLRARQASPWISVKDGKITIDLNKIPK